MDSLRRDDMKPVLKPVVPTKKVIMWCVLRGDASGYATSRLYSRSRAKRFERLAKRFGIDVYAVRFGVVRS